MKHIAPAPGKMCFFFCNFAIKKAPANCRSENKNFICKFEMHPFTQVGCIVSIYGTQAKPYIAYTDSHTDAVCGFVDKTEFYTLNVKFTEGTLSKIAPQKAEVLKEILSNDPRPAYDRENERIYGFKFAHREIKFKVEGKELTVLSIENE